jgi:L-rhamnose isomerase
VLEPSQKLRDAEAAGDHTTRLAVLEELKTLPFGAVWDEHCRRLNAPVGSAWLNEVKTHERDVLSKR